MLARFLRLQCSPSLTASIWPHNVNSPTIWNPQQLSQQWRTINITGFIQIDIINNGENLDEKLGFLSGGYKKNLNLMGGGKTGIIVWSFSYSDLNTISSPQNGHNCSQLLGCSFNIQFHNLIRLTKFWIKVVKNVPKVWNILNINWKYGWMEGAVRDAFEDAI